MKKAIKIALFILAGLAILVCILGILAPKKFKIERGILVQAGRETVWNEVSLWKNFNHWSPWAKMDSSIKVAVKGTDGTVGSSYNWTSKNMGSGSITRTKSEPMNYGENTLEIADWGNTSTTSVTLSDSAGGTWVVWRMWGENGFIGSIFYMVFGMESRMGKDYESGLQDLKRYCESHPLTKLYRFSDVKLSNRPETIYIQLRKQSKMNDYKANASKWMGEMAGELQWYIQKHHLKINGPMCGRYYTWDTAKNLTVFAVAFPVAVKGPESKTDIEYSVVKAGDYAYCDYWGDYSGMKEAHSALGKWITSNSKTLDGPVIEEYFSDPMVEKDHKKWQTHILYPVK